MSGQSRLIALLYSACVVLIMSIAILLLVGVLSNKSAILPADTAYNWNIISQIATALNVMPTLFAAFATGAYAFFFYRLQNELNVFSKNNARDNRLIEISTQWNSTDFVRARNRAFRLIMEWDQPPLKMYDSFYKNGRLDDWIELSLIAHFIERLGRLLADGQIDLRKTQAEFAEVITWWAGFILPFYGPDKDNTSTIEAITNAKLQLNNCKIKCVCKSEIFTVL